MNLDYRCPDCDNDTQLVQALPGVFVVRVLHNNTCPWLDRSEEMKR